MQTWSRPTFAPLRRPRAEGLPGNSDRQDDHRQEPRIDIFCVCERTNRAFAIECKFQDSHGTVDEKIPYALDDLDALPMAGCIAYAGQGFSDGVLHMLEASPHAAYCLPAVDQGRAERGDARARSPDGDALPVVGHPHREQTSSFRSASPAFLNRLSGSRQTAII